MGAEVIYAIAGIVLFVYGVAGRRIRLGLKDFKLFSPEELARWQRFVFAILGLILLIIPLLPILGITLQPQATTPTIEATPTLFPTNTPTPTTPAPPVQTTAVPPTNTPTDPPANTSTATDTPSPTPTVIFMSTFTPPPITPTRSSPICPSADEGTVQPAVAIYSITFVVDGNEQVMNDANSLQGLSGNQVRVKEVTICTVEPFEGSGGRVYVEFDPVDQNAQVIASEVKGTQAVSVSPGFTVIPGPDYTWTIGNWRHISVVTVHYPGGSTQNPNCEGGACEVDDRMIVGIQ